MNISGAWVQAARKAPMPMTTATGTGTRPGHSCCSRPPNSAPSTAPTNSVGVKMPPTAPEPVVAETASTFQNSTASSAALDQWSCRMALTTL